MTSTALSGIRELLGADGVVEHDPVTIAGAEFGATLRPSDAESLAAVLARVAEDGRSVLVRGGGSRVESGNTLRGAELLLTTDRLCGMLAFEPSEGVCRAAAGTPLAQVHAAVNAAGWELPLDPPGANATVGGTIASAALGPRAQGFGAPRRAVLGLELVSANGERTRCGGRVVKNVTGFDLAKLYTGSYGSLGVITSAWLRLRPLPERRCCLEAEVGDPGAALRAGLETSQRDSASAVVTRLSGSSRVWVELAGEAASVERDADWLAREWGAIAAPDTLLERARNEPAQLSGPGGLRFRISTRPTRAAAMHARLREAGAATLDHPGSHLAYAGFRLSQTAAEDEVGDAFACAADAAAQAGGHAVCEQAPDWAKPGRDMWGELGARAPLFAALKQRFDPHGVLNPGLFAGRL